MPRVDADALSASAKLAVAGIPFPNIDAEMAAITAEANLDDIAKAARPLG